MDKDIIDKPILINALCNAFPSPASFNDFKEMDHEVSVRAIPRIVKFAYKNGIIEKETEKAFIEFLANNNKLNVDKPMPEELTFSDIIEILSGNLSVNSLITQLEAITKELSLPKIKASMITRLKKNFLLNTVKKRSLLRILAFRLAEKRPDLNWHYEMLSKITVGSPKISDALKETAGATITLHLQGKGEIITPADINWLKAELSNCIEYLNLTSHVNKKTIVSSGASSFSLKLPKKQGPAEQPRLYDRAIRDSLAMAHQMAVRWLLSEYSSPQKKLIIIIYAGLASEANLLIQPLLETKLTGETGIYLTDFAYLCARVAEVKVGFERYKNKSNSDEGYISDIWTIKYFWSHNFYDYIPYLLEKSMLPISGTDPSNSEFQRVLYFPEQFTESPFEALWAMYRFPQNSLLLIEIAKVLRARQMPYEADAVLSNLLLSNPDNVAARVMRMIIYSNIAQAQADFFIADMAFDRAIAEGKFITQTQVMDSVIWCEFGILYCNRAKKYIKYLRENNPSNEKAVNEEGVLNSFRKAKECFLKALTTSPTGRDGSALFYFLYATCFIELLSSDDKFLSKIKNNIFIDANNSFEKAGIRLFTEIGWLKNTISSDGEISALAFQNFLAILNIAVARLNNSMLSRSYIPYVNYIYSIIAWDFLPLLTVGIYKMVMNLLNETCIETEKLIKNNISVYKISQNFVAPDKFISQIKEAIDLIKKSVTDEDLKREDNSPFDPQTLKELSKIKLIFLELNWY